SMSREQVYPRFSRVSICRTITFGDCVFRVQLALSNSSICPTSSASTSARTRERFPSSAVFNRDASFLLMIFILTFDYWVIPDVQLRKLAIGSYKYKE